jgi:hypothetical protein
MPEAIATRLLLRAAASRIYRDRLAGVCAFATPSSEAVCASVFGVEFKRSVTELHRLVLLDEVRHNAESFFISRAMKLLKQDRPYYSAVLSFADSTQGHRGTIYQATNALYCGMTGRSRFFYDETGRLRHPRQNGVNITLQMAKERGWTGVMREAKYRYLFILPTNKRDRKAWLARLLLTPLPYPHEAVIEYEVAPAGRSGGVGVSCGREAAVHMGRAGYDQAEGCEGRCWTCHTF